MEPTVEGILEHFGVKGMKWGVRRSPEQLGHPQDVKIKAKGSRLIATGGKGQPPSEDAVNAIKSLQKARASSVHALTDQELKHLNSRLQMERNFASLAAIPKNPAREFVVGILKDEGNKLLRGQKGPIVQQVEKLMGTRSARMHGKATVGTGPLKLGAAKIIKPGTK